MTNFLNLPERMAKPRSSGMTVVIDNGRSTGFFQDVAHSHSDIIDVVKFGWGTSLVTQDISKKIETLQDLNIPYFFGGTLFEKAWSQGRLSQFIEVCRSSKCEYIEISDGTIELPRDERSKIIEDLSSDFKVFTEVGFKDQERSKVFAPKEWVGAIKADFEAGACKVITESRESGTSGICRSDGEVRYGLIEEILDSGVDSENLIFEAPNKALQTYFIKKLGSNVNLGNIAFQDIIALETLRLGLRSDTFFTFPESQT